MTTAASARREPGYKYWAFISYSHRDEQWARWLHNALETYRIPAQLAQRTAASDDGLSRERIYPVFRDRDELAGGFDLGERIKTSLEQSRFLIVVCSPHAAASRHVQQEIDVFESFGREDRVVCLIVDGEPGASSRPETAQQECLPSPVRTKRSPEGDLVPCEPIAADARKEKDGRTNAKLKILAEMLRVPFDELKQRDARRRFRRRMYQAAAAAAALVVLSAGFLLALDAGIAGPGGTTVRRVADRYGVSLMRRVPPESAVYEKARSLRQRLASRLLTARKDDWFLANFKGEDKDNDGVWIHSQVAFVLLGMPDGGKDHLQDVASTLAKPFVTDLKIERGGVRYGWLARQGELSPMSVPAFWTAMSLAVAIGRDAYATPAARTDALTRLTYVQEALAPYQPAGTQGWNMFPDQSSPSQHNVYAATLALMALLETRKANLPWQGSIDRRDQLIRQTSGWLTAQFDPRTSPPGWKAGGENLDLSFEGLSMQVYGRLLDAELTSGISIPAEIRREIPRHLGSIAGRPWDFPSSSAEFVSTVRFASDKPYVARESITFPWYPWTIDCAIRWLRSPDGRAAPAEERVAVQRTLAHLVMTLGDPTAAKASDDWTFVAAEMLYGLSNVAPERLSETPRP